MRLHYELTYDWHWHPPNGELIKWPWLGLMCKDELSLELGLKIPNICEYTFWVGLNPYILSFASSCFYET